MINPLRNAFPTQKEVPVTISPTITYEPMPQPDEVEIVRRGLSAYNRERAPDDTFEPLILFVRAVEGVVLGGLLGGTIWSWLYVDILWLSDALRGQGYGSRLLAEAERLARERGCIGSHLTTMSFQARDFYERYGYTVYGVLEDFPPGHRKFMLRKLFQQHQ
ncbi:MAG TPA: GNAT family N-acetyltransferase [Anaerolineales bacterium]|nr:GNAT family N-acetyltransferase [Anaerolineales bacterium]